MTAYLPLLKLRICAFVVMAAVVGLVAVPGGTDLSVVAALVASTLLASTGASIFNHWFDNDIDRLMERTRARPLASGRLPSGPWVPALAVLFLASSIVLSAVMLNPMASAHLALGAFFYAVVYTVWLKRRTWLNIVVGGLAGSFAVLAGGASNEPALCLPPVLFGVVLFFWTPTHFWTFAMLRSDDYERAGVPMLPVVAGPYRTALFVVANTVLLVASSVLPYAFGFQGPAYLAGAVVSGAGLLYLNVRLLARPGPGLARLNFRASLVYLALLCASVGVDRVV